MGFDLKYTDLALDWVLTYQQDITEMQKVREILQESWITEFDAIISDIVKLKYTLK